MKLQTLLQDELERDNWRVSESFLQSIRDMGPIKQHFTQGADWSKPNAMDSCPCITEDLSKVETVEDLRSAIERLKEDMEKNMPDLWGKTRIVEMFIPFS